MNKIAVNKREGSTYTVSFTCALHMHALMQTYKEREKEWSNEEGHYGVQVCSRTGEKQPAVQFHDVVQRTQAVVLFCFSFSRG